jgi:hypothetical protein
LHHIKAGADAAVIDPVGRLLITRYLHDDDALECAYSDLLVEIVALPGPTPWDRLLHLRRGGISTGIRLRLTAGSRGALLLRHEIAAVRVRWQEVRASDGDSRLRHDGDLTLGSRGAGVRYAPGERLRNSR